MTNSSPESFNIRQRWNNDVRAKSEISGMTERMAVLEIIDNAIDETPQGEQTVVEISINVRDNTLTFKNRNTLGMNQEKMERFVTWGVDHGATEQIKQHGVGAKHGILRFLSQDRGNLTVVSKPRYSAITYGLFIPQWWKNLTPQADLKVETKQTGVMEQEGYTVFLLEGVNPERMPYSSQELADQLGMHFGHKLALNQLSIKILCQDKKGAPQPPIHVVPTIISFDESQVKEDKLILPKYKVKASVRWGFVDPERKRRDEQSRMGVYGLKKVTSHQGDRVYIYHHGRLIEDIPLSHLKIEGYQTSRNTMLSVAVEVNLTEGGLPLTQFKDKLDVNAPQTKELQAKIAALIGPDIKLWIGESHGQAVPENYRLRTREASAALATVLNGMFKGNLKLIASHLISSGQLTETETKSKPASEIKTTNLSGSKQKSFAEKKNGSHPTETVWVNPIPELVLTSYEQSFPMATFVVTPDNRPVIEINFTSPAVKAAYQTKGNLFKNILLTIAGRALFAYKCSKDFPTDSAIYEIAVEEELGKFLKAAEDLKII